MTRRCMFMELQMLADDEHLIHKRLAVHCPWWRQAYLVHPDPAVQTVVRLNLREDQKDFGRQQ